MVVLRLHPVTSVTVHRRCRLLLIRTRQWGFGPYHGWPLEPRHLLLGLNRVWSIALIITFRNFKLHNSINRFLSYVNSSMQGIRNRLKSNCVDPTWLHGFVRRCPVHPRPWRPHGGKRSFRTLHRLAVRRVLLQKNNNQVVLFTNLCNEMTCSRVKTIIPKTIITYKTWKHNLKN